jgi:competence protein ComEA
VEPQPPAWRVFDAPAAPAREAGSGASSAPADSAISAGAPPAITLRSPAVLGLLGSMVLVVAAVAVAMGEMSGTAVDVGAGPIASSDAVSIGAAGGLVIEVAGAVARPGVYRLAPGSRLGDAVAAAGGFGPRVDASRVAAELNLAAVLHDGDRVLVPSRDDPIAASDGTGGSGAKASPALVDLNHATVAELDALPGIGPVTADKIVASRADSAFGSVDELRTRGLVGQKTFDRLKPLVTVG